MSQALYQKYRPQNFDEVIGQDEAIQYFRNVAESAQNTTAPQMEKLAKAKQSINSSINHAYLLTGGRGVGKTTLARIFAKSLGTADADIIELDTASNRGIDEIKELREATLSRPISSTYKVFIMDEVHMITTQGANALLKTLEEPTPWTIFILCTTDPEKLISTIVSRCQVINLKSPNEANVFKLLSKINKDENLNLNDDTLKVISSLNHESYRDAVGELERVSWYKGTYIKIDYDNISINIIRGLLNNDLKDIFVQIEKIDTEHGNSVYHKVYLHIVKIYRLLLMKKAGVLEKSSQYNNLNEIARDDISVLESKHKDKIRSDTLRTLLDNECIWAYNSINNREKLELVLMNVNAT